MIKFGPLSLAVALALPCLPAAAQAPAPAAAPNIPDKIPFGQPYGASINLDQAQHLIATVQAEAKKRGWFFNITVVDTHGDLVAFARMDDAQLASISISQHKARTAARWRRETAVLNKAYEAGHAYLGTLDPEMAASPGGFPLVLDGKIVGGLGCSGGTGDQDALVCKVGADSFK